MKIEKISAEIKYMVEMSESELAAMYELINKQVNSKEKCSSTQFEIYNKLYPLFAEPLEEKSQSTIIADYILENCPDEIVEGGVANTAIKLIERLLPMLPRKTERTDINSWGIATSGTIDNGFYNKNSSDRPTVTFEEHKQYL